MLPLVISSTVQKSKLMLKAFKVHCIRENRYKNGSIISRLEEPKAASDSFMLIGLALGQLDSLTASN